MSVETIVEKIQDEDLVGAIRAIDATMLSEPDREKVIRSCLANDDAIVAYVALRGGGIGVSDPHPLIHATEQKKPGMVNLLARRPDVPDAVVKKALALAKDDGIRFELEGELQERRRRKRQAKRPAIDSELEATLFASLEEGDTGPLEAALANGLDPNSLSGGQPLLSLLAFVGEGARVLIEAGADVHADGNEEVLPTAASLGHLPALDVLVPVLGPESDAAAEAMVGAVRSMGGVKVVERLLSLGVTPNASYEGESAIGVAAEEGSVAVELLLAHGAEAPAGVLERAKENREARREGEKDAAAFLRGFADALGSEELAKYADDLDS
ncbi:MAG: hypothetical protein AAGE52_42110 [Myxococcota bacterium]